MSLDRARTMSRYRVFTGTEFAEAVVSDQDGDDAVMVQARRFGGIHVTHLQDYAEHGLPAVVAIGLHDALLVIAEFVGHGPEGADVIARATGFERMER